MGVRDSLINMLAEFVGLYKTPDFKLNAQSSKAIAEAVAAESRRYSVCMNCQQTNDEYVHQRTFSSSSVIAGRAEVSMDPACRRFSEPFQQPNYSPPKWRKLHKCLSNEPQKSKEQKQSSVIGCGVGDEEVEGVFAERSTNSARRRWQTRRGSETFCGSVAAYSNNLSTINTRL